jgi:hypothetical protein
VIGFRRIFTRFEQACLEPPSPSYPASTNHRSACEGHKSLDYLGRYYGFEDATSVPTLASWRKLLASRRCELNIHKQHRNQWDLRLPFLPHRPDDREEALLPPSGNEPRKPLSLPWRA